MEDHSLFHIDLLDELVDDNLSDFFDANKFTYSSDFDYTCVDCTDSMMCNACLEIETYLQGDDVGCASSDDNADIVSTNTDFVELKGTEILPTAMRLPSILQPPTLELKPLPEHLKYAYLEENEELPIIISTNLNAEQEEKLLGVLRKQKKAIGWTLADISGISLSMCMHRILLEDGAKSVRQPQRRLNPLILDVVKKEVTKLLQAGIIYPILDSTWVSPIQVVLKKSGITIVKNEKDQLIPTRVQNS